MTKWIAISSLVVCMATVACEDIFESSIANEQVVLISPADSALTQVNRQTFKWEALEHALSYHFQLSSLSFDSVKGVLLLDTVVKGTSLAHTLASGTYQWRVQARNGSSETAYTTRTIRVDSTTLDLQQVILSGPTTDTIQKETKVVFAWENLPNATRYHIQIDTVNFDETQLLVSANASTNRFIHTFQREGTYQWRVRAENDAQVSMWSAIRTLSIDYTAPEKVQLLSPANNQTVKKPVNLYWSIPSDARKYRLYMYQADSTTYLNTSFPVVLTTDHYEFNAGDLNQRVYWRVKAIDAAGNESTFSELRNFVIGQ